MHPPKRYSPRLTADCSKPPVPLFRIRIGILAALAIALLYGTRGQGQCLPAVNRYYGYTFMHPLMADPRLPGAPQILGFDEVYKRFGRQDREQADENVREWRARYCDIPKEEDVREVIYAFTPSDFWEMNAAIAANSSTLDPFLRKNTFARYLVRHRCQETVEYLLFAKDCEPYVTKSGNAWAEQDNSLRKAEMDRLIEKGKTAFMQTQSDYIRLRYAFQIVRLAHYSGQYQRTLDLFDYLMPKIDHDPSAIEFWILGHKAGALAALGRKVEAAYLYVRVFLNCPGKRESAYRSFRINTDEEWAQCLLLCKDDRERATLFAMRAQQQTPQRYGAHLPTRPAKPLPRGTPRPGNQKIRTPVARPRIQYPQN